MFFERENKQKNQTLQYTTNCNTVLFSYSLILSFNMHNKKNLMDKNIIFLLQGNKIYLF